MQMKTALICCAVAMFVIGESTSHAWVTIDSEELYGCSDTLHPEDPDAPEHVWSSIAATGTSVALSDDRVSPAVPIGFDFNFYEVDYTQAFISSNGFITFVSTTSSGCCSGHEVPSELTPNALVAVAWEDLNPSSGGSIYYETRGTDGARSFIVEYNGIEHFGGGGRVTAQIELREGSDEIYLHYLEDSDASGTHTVGIENETGEVGIQVYRGLMSGIDLSGATVVCVPIRDSDEDGFTLAEGDCDDRNDTVYPEAEELCDGLDNDCDDEIDEGHERSTFYADLDGDGFGDDDSMVEACAVPPRHTATPGDCDDSCVSCHPDGVELCDERDNDCDGEADEEEDITFVTYFRDTDGDTYGVDGTEETTCEERPGMALRGGDCNDGCSTCYPGADEICDELDNDCDTEVDEESEQIAYFRDADGDTYGVEGTETITCLERPGWITRAGDCNDECASCYPDAEEICDELDNDCDTEVDEGLTVTLWPDGDGDGFGNPVGERDYCEVLEGYVTNGEDCHDANADINPEADEICDEWDNDCDGEIDEGVTLTTFYRDGDGDGFGTSEETTEACLPPDGFVVDETDCDDSNEEINPDAEEILYDGIDNDCDGEVDEGEGPDGDADGDSDADTDADADGDADVDADSDADADADSPPDDGQVEAGCGCRTIGHRSSVDGWLQAMISILIRI